MPQFELKVPKDEINLWAQEYWDKSNRADEKAAFDSGKRIREGGLSDEELKGSLKEIIHWKSPRVVHYFDDDPPVGNSSEKIRKAIDNVIASGTTVHEAVEALTELRGVGVPVASAILTAIFPERYTVIDFRALEALGHDSAGIEFYRQYLEHCQKLAESPDIHVQGDLPAPTALRALNRALWQWSASQGKLEIK